MEEKIHNEYWAQFIYSLRMCIGWLYRRLDPRQWVERVHRYHCNKDYTIKSVLKRWVPTSCSLQETFDTNNKYPRSYIYIYLYSSSSWRKYIVVGQRKTFRMRQSDKVFNHLIISFSFIKYPIKWLRIKWDIIVKLLYESLLLWKYIKKLELFLLLRLYY